MKRTQRKRTQHRPRRNPQKKWPAHGQAQEKGGIRTGQVIITPKGLVRVVSIFRHGRGSWVARVVMEDGAQTGMPITELAKAAKEARAMRPKPTPRPAGKQPKPTAHKRGGGVRTTTHTVQTRVSNPRARRQTFALVAQAPRRQRLRYTGTNFANHGRPALFTTLGQVRRVASTLRRKYGRVLRRYSLYAEPRAGKS